MSARRPDPDAPLVGDVVRLDRLRVEDAAALFAAIGSADVFAGGYGGGPGGLPDGTDAFAAWMPGYFPLETGNSYAVRLVGGPNDGLLVGTTTLSDFDLRSEHAHLGWTAYDPRVWGTAVNAACKRLVLGAAFEHDLGRVKIQADVLNTRSRAAIAGIGAVYEGITRRDKPRADGTWRDSAVFSVIVDDWDRVRGILDARLAASPGPVGFRAR
jgi:N-acetyltransferase